MAREKRKVSPTGIYHILLRGIDELFSKDKDYQEFITILESYFNGADCTLLGYALMNNRAHMIIDEGNKGISLVMKSVCTSYARYYNRVHKLQGKLFYDRYKSEPVIDIEGVKSFLNKLPAEYKGGVENSSEDIVISIDDYCRMTDEELKDYIEDIFGCIIDDMTKEERKTLAQRITEGKKISTGRIYKIFNLGRKVPDVKRKEKTEQRAPEPEKKNERNGGLSVWLL